MYIKQKKLLRTQYLDIKEAGTLCSIPNRNHLSGIRNLAIIKTFLNTGLRQQELVNLKVKDLRSDDRGWYLLVHSKGGTLDEQPIESEETISIIKKYLKANGHSHRPAEPLFQPLPNYTKPESKKISRTALTYMLAKYAKKAGITKKVTCHTLRHTFGTAVYNATRDIVVVQKLMRHRSISSTSLYMHTDNKTERMGLEKASF